jgi:ATP/ADP translocase
MIIYGKALRHKTLKRVITIILILFIGFIALSCSKIEFDPTTFTIKKIFTTNRN